MKPNDNLPIIKNKGGRPKNNPDVLTKKQQVFVDAIMIEGLKPLDAYLRVNPSVTRTSAINAASRWLNLPVIKKSLSSLANQIKSLEKVPLHYLVQKLKNLLELCEKEKNYKYFLECADMLMKAGGYYTQQKVVTNINLNTQNIDFNGFNPDANSIIDITPIETDEDNSEELS